MSRFSSFFRQLRALDRNSSLPFFFYALILFALLAYVLPWVHNPGQALTLGGYDLAEWLSLHPGVRGQTPPLMASALLRLHLPLLTALIVLWRPRGTALIIGACVLLLAVAQFPPLEFISQSHDINYRQQFGLSVFTLIFCGVLALRYTGTQTSHSYVKAWNQYGPAEMMRTVVLGIGHQRALVTLMIALIGVVLCVLGLAQAREMMQVFKLPANVSLGAPLLAGVYLVMVGALLRRLIWAE